MSNNKVPKVPEAVSNKFDMILALVSKFSDKYKFIKLKIYILKYEISLKNYKYKSMIYKIMAEQQNRSLQGMLT